MRISQETTRKFQIQRMQNDGLIKIVIIVLGVVIYSATHKTRVGLLNVIHTYLLIYVQWTKFLLILTKRKLERDFIHVDFVSYPTQ